MAKPKKKKQMSRSTDAALAKAEKRAVKDYLAEKASKSWKSIAETAQKGKATAEAALRKANERANGGQLVAAGISTMILAPLAAGGQVGLANATASMVKPDESAPEQFVSTTIRKIVAHGTLPVLGLVVGGVSLKYGGKHGLVTAGLVGGSLGVIIGSVLSSMRTPLPINPIEQNPVA